MRNTRKIIILYLLLTLPLAAQEVTHTVKKGETLYSIARNYSINLNTLMEFNNIEDPSKLSIGSVLKIPSAYRVEKGDTLYGIANKFSTTVENILALNNIPSTKVLKIGDLLIVPAAPQDIKEPESEVKVSGPASPEPAEKKDDKESLNSLSGSTVVSWPHSGIREVLTGKLEGIAIRGNPGDSVVSVTYGEVVLVQPFRGYGKLVCIQSQGNYIYAYAGNEVTTVKVGDKVYPGMEIGKLGINPHAKEAKLFFTVSRDGKIIDPEKAPRG